jgi:hypothetical protein
MSDNITLPRELAEEVLEALIEARALLYDGRKQDKAATALRAALAAPRLAVTVDPRLTPDEAAAISSALAAPRQKPEPVAYFDLQKQVFFWAKPTMIDVPMTVALNPLPLYTAPPAAAPEPVRHPGYLIGNHWLETAYSRVCAGEAEADVLRDCGWERVDEALRRDAERLTDEQIDSATSKERDQLLDHIYEYGTAAEGILERIRKLARAAIDAAMEKGDKT